MQLDQELLAAWLNFANGGLEPRRSCIDTIKDQGIPPTRRSPTVMANAEAIRNNPLSTKNRLKDQRDAAQAGQRQQGLARSKGRGRSLVRPSCAFIRPGRRCRPRLARAFHPRSSPRPSACCCRPRARRWPRNVPRPSRRAGTWRVGPSPSAAVRTSLLDTSFAAEEVEEADVHPADGRLAPGAVRTARMPASAHRDLVVGGLARNALDRDALRRRPRDRARAGSRPSRRRSFRPAWSLPICPRRRCSRPSRHRSRRERSATSGSSLRRPDRRAG